MDWAFYYKCDYFNWKINIVISDWDNPHTLWNSLMINRPHVREREKMNCIYSLMSYIVLDSLFYATLKERCKNWNNKDQQSIKQIVIIILNSHGESHSILNKFTSLRHNIQKSVYFWLFVCQDRFNNEIFLNVKNKIKQYIDKCLPVLINDYIEKCNKADKLFTSFLHDKKTKKKVKKIEKKKKIDSFECAVCLELFLPKIKLFPCNHASLCDLCHPIITERHGKCVLCRAKIEYTIPI